MFKKSTPSENSFPKLYIRYGKLDIELAGKISQNSMSQAQQSRFTMSCLLPWAEARCLNIENFKSKALIWKTHPFTFREWAPHNFGEIIILLLACRGLLVVTDFREYPLGITLLPGKCELGLIVWGDESVGKAGRLTGRQLCPLSADWLRKQRMVK